MSSCPGWIVRRPASQNNIDWLMSLLVTTNTINMQFLKQIDNSSKTVNSSGKLFGNIQHLEQSWMLTIRISVNSYGKLFGNAQYLELWWMFTIRDDETVESVDILILMSVPHLVLLTWPRWARQWSLSRLAQSLAYLEFLLGAPETRATRDPSITSTSILTSVGEVGEILGN